MFDLIMLGCVVLCFALAEAFAGLCGRAIDTPTNASSPEAQR
jgi:hypothetical protein